MNNNHAPAPHQPSLQPQERVIAELAILEAMQHYQASADQSLPSDERSSHLAKAERLTRRSLQQHPHSPQLLNLLGRIALDRNQLADAERLLKQALGQSPLDAGIHYSLGHAYLAQRQLDSAESSFKQALQRDPSLFRAKTSLAYTLKEKGDAVGAYQLYRELIREKPEDPHSKSKLFECLGELQADQYSEALARELTYYLGMDGVDYSLMSRIVATLLTRHYGLGEPDAPAIELHALASDQLLLLALRKLIIADPKIEDLLTGARDAILFETLNAGSLDNTCVSLAVSLATNAHLTEYAWWISPEASELLETIRTFVIEEAKKPECDWALIEIPLLMFSMYRPIAELDMDSLLLERTSTSWSYFMRPLIQSGVVQRAAEQAHARQIPRLTAANDPTSVAVQQQYEEHPYPRWTTLQYHTETEYARALASELPGINLPTYLKQDDIQILVAGCGTGRHAIYVARYFKRAQVTAIDLSATSLAYASRMAQSYGLDNIRFMQADILALQELGQKFHIIECSGVLHHMANPLQGCQALSQLLAPGGLIKLGLYSRRARAQVSLYRETHPVDTHIDDDQLRARRHALLAEMSPEYANIFASPDFYSLSGCRDLVCHEQEHVFSPLELSSMLDECKLDFLGFVRLNAHTRQRYLRLFPEDPLLQNLQHWDDFEAAHPATFGAMFQFYCQART